MTHHEWQERFIDNTTNYLNAQIWELNNRIKKQIPSIEDYLIKRQHTGGVLPFFDLIEVVARVYLPPEAMNSLVIELISAANNLLAWSNDIMSLKKELAIGEVHNMVIILQHHDQISMREALERASDMHELELEKYLELERRLFEQESPYRNELETYTYGLRAWIRGNLDWGMESERYQVTNQ